ncbi:hypothetical protein Aph01nite_74780 [Acrocarpospora phusangensis]|uniref:Uncharacterized protein n=1 Tax=Acrocarpospora phusangensis TaxID=1070424 RepID=A0A919QI12_9ACTN|nr:hypothetical protein Aph01nite_74780 [Acrocarpospora phusangensis]
MVDPTSIVGGSTKNVRVTAFCPPAQPGTTYKASARSDAFTGIVSLMPPLAATPAATPAAEPSLTGVALLSANAKAGGYRVEVRCEATNDLGSARFRVTAAPPTGNFPTKAPGAGGGGTAAGGPEEESGVPVTPITIGLLAAFFIGIGVARRRNRG